MAEIKELIDRILSGERDLFREIITEFGPGIRAYLSAHLSDPHTIDDIAQEIFVAVFENLAQYRLDADFGRWIRGIAYNKLMMHLRSFYRKEDVIGQVRTNIAEEINESLYMETRDDHAETIHRMRECIEKLPDRVLDIVRAKYYNRERVNAIAHRLKSTVSAISSLLYRGRKLLQSCMEGDM